MISAFILYLAVNKCQWYWSLSEKSLLQEFNIVVSYSCEDVAPISRLVPSCAIMTDSMPMQTVSPTTRQLQDATSKTVVIFSGVKLYLWYDRLLFCLLKHSPLSWTPSLCWTFVSSVPLLRRWLFLWTFEYVAFPHGNSNAEIDPCAHNIINYYIELRRKIIFFDALYQSV